MRAPQPWWREAVTYEIYVRSFADSNGDGMGDLPGVRTHLPYVRDLGVDALWLTPFYPSPDRDAGYDVSDHRAVDPRFGTLSDVDDVIAGAHGLGLRVIVDLVLNHVSSEHPWFRAARAAGPGSPERARFHVRRGRGDGPPTNWRSIFQGPAWSPLGDGDWYLHMFDAEQPDLNHGHPEVADDTLETIRFWLDRGVDGLRFDAAGLLAKDPTYPDLPPEWGHGDPSPFGDRAEVHEIYRTWTKVLGGYPGDRLGVAEIWGHASVLAPYLRPDELHQAFAIDPLFWPLRVADWRPGIDTLIDATAEHGRLPSWVHGNHDVQRAATRWGPDGARAVLMLMLALPGSVYLYAGDELGLPEAHVPDEAIRDPVFRRSGGTERGRDGARIPLPWPENLSPHSWLPQPAGWARYAPDRQEVDPASVLTLTRRAIALRDRIWRGRPAKVSWLDTPAGCIAFRRGTDGPVCLTNLSADPVPWRPYGAGVLLSTALGTWVPGPEVPPAATFWLDGASANGFGIDSSNSLV